MDIPSLDQARDLLSEAAELNPGPWVQHSVFAAQAAQAIAQLHPSLDPTTAYILALLHDIGRRVGVTDLRHMIDGYRYLEALGFSWKNLEAMGLELYYLESNCEFKGRAFFADILNVYTRIAKLSRSTMGAEMLITKSTDNKVVAAGRITAVMVSNQTGKSTPIPSDLREAIKENSVLQPS